jgi:hypothetical protein
MSGHRQHALDQDPRIRRIGHPVDERAVDLDDVEAELAEVPEAGGSGAEIVEGEGHARPADVGHEVAGLVNVVQGLGLGDLEDQPAEQPGIGRRGPVEGCEPALVAHGERRDVHRQAQVPPSPQQVERARQREAVDRPPERAPLDRGEKRPRRQRGARGRHDPGQHLVEGDEAARAGAHDRLQVELDAALRERLGHREARPRRAVEGVLREGRAPGPWREDRKRTCHGALVNRDLCATRRTS